MKYKLFGKNIVPDCSYCENAVFENRMVICQKGRMLSEGRCRAFRYDPLMRIPASVSLSGNFTAEDFKL